MIPETATHRSESLDWGGYVYYRVAASGDHLEAWSPVRNVWFRAFALIEDLDRFIKLENQ